MNPWLQWLSSAAVSAVILAFINGLFSKRKLSADATKIITEAASGVVEIQKAEIARVLASNLELTQKVDTLQARVDRGEKTTQVQGEAIAIHTFWDIQAVEELGKQGINLPPPPPLNSTPG